MSDNAANDLRVGMKMIFGACCSRPTEIARRKENDIIIGDYGAREISTLITCNASVPLALKHVCRHLGGVSEVLGVLQANLNPRLRTELSDSSSFIS